MILRDVKPGDVFRLHGGLWTKTTNGLLLHVCWVNEQPEHFLSHEEMLEAESNVRGMMKPEDEVQFVPIVKGVLQ